MLIKTKGFVIYTYNYILIMFVVYNFIAMVTNTNVNDHIYIVHHCNLLLKVCLLYKNIKNIWKLIG